MRTRFCVIAVLCVLPVFAHRGIAQPIAEPATKWATLQAGEAAPPFEVERFIKGKPFTNFAKGRIYVIEFWATNCGPCVQVMPHLSALQQEYLDDGVTICAVNIWEEPEITPATLERVQKFVTNRGEAMAYAVAYDGAKRFMDNAWMQADGSLMIPRAFVVDRQGTIAWIGHPDQLDLVLKEVMAGTWDITEGPRRIAAAERDFDDALAAYKTSLAAGEAAWFAASQRYPSIARLRTADRFTAMLQADHATAAFALGNEIVEIGKQTRNPTPMQNMMVTLSQYAHRDDEIYKALYLNAAHATFALADATEPGPYAVLALAYFATGHTEEGRAAAAKAIELSDPNIRATMEKYLKKDEEQFQPKGKASTN